MTLAQRLQRLLAEHGFEITPAEAQKHIDGARAFVALFGFELNEEKFLAQTQAHLTKGWKLHG